MNYFNITTSLIKHNQDSVTREIQRINRYLNQTILGFNRYLVAKNVLDQIHLTLQTILQLLTDLENAITFAKMNILHTSILKPKELQTIVKIIYNIILKISCYTSMTAK